LINGLFDELPDPKSKKLTPQEQPNWLEGATVILRILVRRILRGTGSIVAWPNVSQRRNRTPKVKLMSSSASSC